MAWDTSDMVMVDALSNPHINYSIPYNFYINSNKNTQIRESNTHKKIFIQAKYHHLYNKEPKHVQITPKMLNFPFFKQTISAEMLTKKKLNLTSKQATCSLIF